VSPTDTVLVTRLASRTWQPIVALFVGQSNRVSESGVNLRSLGAFGSAAEESK
jgi:hypothetical protein